MLLSPRRGRNGFEFAWIFPSLITAEQANRFPRSFRFSARVELYFQRSVHQLYWDTQRNRSRYYNLRDAELAVRW